MNAGGGETFGPDGFQYRPLPAHREYATGTVPLRQLDANDTLKSVFATVRHYLAPLYLPLLAVALGSTVLLSGCAYLAWTLITPFHLRGERMTTGREVDLAIGAAV